MTGLWAFVTVDGLDVVPPQTIMKLVNSRGPPTQPNRCRWFGPQEHGSAREGPVEGLTDGEDSYKRGLATRPRWGWCAPDARPAYGRRFGSEAVGLPRFNASLWPNKSRSAGGGLFADTGPLVCQSRLGDSYNRGHGHRASF